jgi:hypothetical protein
LVLVATAFLTLAPVSVFGLSAEAADPAPTDHEAAVLDRIFAN